MRRMFSKQQIEQSSERISIEAIGNLPSMLQESMGEIVDSVDTWSNIPLADEDGSMWTSYEISEEELENHMIVRTLDDGDALSVKVWVKIPEHITTAEEYVNFAESGEEPFIIVKVQSQTFDEAAFKYIDIGNLRLLYENEDPTEFYWEGEKFFYDDDDVTLIGYGILLTGHLYLSLRASTYNIANQGNLKITFGTSSNKIQELYAERAIINRGSNDPTYDFRNHSIYLPNNYNGVFTIRNFNYTGLKLDKDQVKLTTNDNKGFIVKNDDTFLIQGLPTSDPHVANALWNDNGVLKISAGA